MGYICENIRGEKIKIMLREYIETRYKTNKAMCEELEEQIHALQEERQAAEAALKELQKDQDVEKSIFSPRSQLGGTPEKLAEIRTKLTETEKKLEAADAKQQIVKKEGQEIEQLLAEVLELQQTADKQAVTVKAEKADEAEVIKPEQNETTSERPERSGEMKKENGETEKRSGKTDTNVERISEEADERDKEVASVMTQQDMSAADTESDATEVAGDTETNAVMLENEEAGEEKPEQTLDMERLNDLLSDVYRKAEFCTAFLCSDKNKCRNLLKEMKKELKKYAEEIAEM